MIKNVHWSTSKVPIILVRFYRNLNFLGRFSQNLQISSFMKIRPVDAELYHGKRRTDTTKVMITFSNFANAHNKTM